MKKTFLIFVVALCCAAASIYYWMPASAQVLVNQLPRQAQKREAFSKLIDTASRTETVRVIVGLEMNFQPDGGLRKQEITRQRGLIKESQNKFLNRFQSARIGGIKQFDTIPFVAVETDLNGLEQMHNDPLIASIEEDVLDEPTLAQSTQVVGAPTAWTNGFSGNGWTVAVLDTGVAKNHSFLAGKVVSEACYSSNVPGQNATSVCPEGVTNSIENNSGLNCDSSITGCAHGTHVAGIAGGRGTGFSGVAKDSNIIAIQVFTKVDNATSCGSNPTPCALSYVSDQIKGLERVMQLSDTMNIAAANMSLGGGQFTATCDVQQSSRKAVIDNLRSVGIATVIASGNNGFTNSIGAPACISSAVSVGSTGDGSSGATVDVVSNFSNSSSFLSLLAPGQWINSSVPTNSYQNYSGTSMSAPHVAGAWAILKQSKPNASVTQVLNALTSTGLPITDTRNNITKPRIKIPEAIAALNRSSSAFDFDGDGKADVSVFRPSNGAWYLNQSTSGFTGSVFGLGTDKLVSADFDGDGKTDVAVYRDGIWYIQRSQLGFTGVAFGTAEDIPVPADYDGDGKADIAVFRPSNGTWYIMRSQLGFLGVAFGLGTDKPVPADYDGDGKADIAVNRDGTWYIQRSQLGFTGMVFGEPTDKLVPADYDGDGKADIAVFRPSNGTWYIMRSQLGFTGVAFGQAGDKPVAADYDGDGKADISVFRPTNGSWYRINSQNNQTTGAAFGLADDLPIANIFVR